MDDNKRVSEAYDMENLRVTDLRRYLRKYGLPVTGSKSELQCRLKNAREMGRKQLSELQIMDDKQKEIRNGEKLLTSLGERLPEPTNLHSGWSNDVRQFPDLTESDIYNYLVLNNQRTFDGKPTKALRQLKAKVFYNDRHVHNLMYHTIDNDISHCYIKGKVIPSLPTQSENKQPDYVTWICLAKLSGQVHAAGCSCSAGEGESCNHVAAVLYALVDISMKKKEGLDAVTSKECLWNKPRARKLSPKKSSELIFKKQKFNHGQEQVPPKAKRSLVSTPPVTPFNMECFKRKLKDCNPHAALLLGFSDTASEKINALCHSEQHLKLHNISFMYHEKVDVKSHICQNQFQAYFTGLSCPQEQCDKIELKTRGQYKNKNWEVARNGRMCSSIFGLVCRKKENTSCNSLVKAILYPSSLDAPSIKWGRSHEPAARRFYLREMRAWHPNLCVSESGLLVNPIYPHLGASPDGLVKCDHCSVTEGLLEIKCPHKYRNETPLEAAKNSDFCCELDSGKLKLKETHIYYYQIQGQMAISGRSWCDLYIWTLKGSSVQRIFFNENFWQTTLQKLNNFYVDNVIPELFTSRIERNMSNND